MAVTLKAVAGRAEVSVATANQVLNGFVDRFAESTCERVQVAARDLEYVPNMAARSLQKQRSYLIGVLFSDANASLFSEFTHGVMQGIGSTDYSPIVFSHDSLRTEAKCLERCLHRKVDGLIVGAGIDEAGQTNTDFYSKVMASGLPLVEVFGRFVPEAVSGNVDLKQAGKMVVDHLRAAGHQSIAHLTHDRYDVARHSGIGPHYDAWEMFRGYEQTMLSSGLTPVLITHPLRLTGGFSQSCYESGYASLRSIMAHPAKPSAVFCYNDDQAYGLIQACHDEGIAVPDRLAIVGYGDEKLARIIRPRLTTLRRPSRETGRRASELLLRMIEKETVESVTLEPELMVRESA
ncbi:MAG: LacI family DNA-binding transcriptional regulator [Verrucomicrobia bacterium]|nr:LacI family DNA-binding transcriptional regulator [Verrucomicrobiota bacterium]